MRLLIAGGGTGGHLFPGIAIAETLRAAEADAPVLFVGTARGIEARVLPELGWDLELIRVRGLKTVGLLGALRGLLSIPGSLLQSRRILKQFRPDVVIGVGGYASGPAVLMARLIGIPTAVLEQNSMPGLTNRILGKVVHSVFLAFEESRRFFAPRKVVMTGNPIRAEIVAALSDGDSSAPERQRPAVLIVGGSQGAVAVNRVVVAAFSELAKRGQLPARIVHQTGRTGYEETVAGYREAGVEADCREFISDMAGAYRDADLVISRAGATTVAELTIVGRPALLIPYPHAADNHQEINARELVDAAAARMFRQGELTSTELADAIAEILSDDDLRSRMGSAMKSLGRPRAAHEILDWCRERTGGNAAKRGV